MFAVLRTGGKQYKVQKDDVIKVEKLDAETGKTIDLNEVLFLSDGKTATIGEPLVKGASVKAEVLEQKKDKKIVIFKKKRRQNYRRTKGHRQPITILRIKDIKAA
ncbi:50S ribosomal protein L21 [Alphaproteobacteria bacterium]|nr:50S ribosomal protein L21 [Alphaproteobacteria bacterium]